MCGQPVISMRENGKTVLKRGQVQSSLQMGMCLLGLIKMADQMGKANTNGQMELIMLVTSLMDLNMVMVNGKRVKLVQSQATKENTKGTKSMGMEFFTGLVETFTKATFKMTSVMVVVS